MTAQAPTIVGLAWPCSSRIPACKEGAAAAALHETSQGPSASWVTRSLNRPKHRNKACKTTYPVPSSVLELRSSFRQREVDLSTILPACPMRTASGIFRDTIQQDASSPLLIKT